MSCVGLVTGAVLLRKIPQISGGNPRVMGPADADVKIVEYVDFQCGACQQASFLLKQYMKKYPSRILLEAKTYPLSGHPYGFLSAQYAHCAAGAGKFWPFYNLVFERQIEWSHLPHPASVKGRFAEIARMAGLDPVKLEACADDPATRRAVEKEKDAGSEMGVRSTPTFFVNGQAIVGTKELTRELDKYFPNEKPAQGR